MMHSVTVAPFAKKLNFMLIQLLLISSFVFSFYYPHSTSEDRGVTFNALFDLPQVIFGTTKEGVIYASNLYKITIINGESALRFTLTYSVAPNSSLIKVYFDKSSFELGSNEKYDVQVRIVVEKGIPSGDYTLYVRVLGSKGEGGNVVQAAVSKKILVFIRGFNPIVLKVNTLLTDGTPIPGEFYIYWKVNGSLLLLHHDLGPSKFYYVIEGEYIVRGVFGNNITDEKDVMVDRNTTVNLYYSPFIIRNFKIDRPPIYATDPLVFSFVLENKIPTLKRKVIEVKAYISGDSGNVTQDLGTFVINGEQSVVIRGVIDPPNTWRNESYQITISITSNGKILGYFKSILEIHVRYPSISKPEINYFLLAITAGIGGILGALSVMVLTKRRKTRREETNIYEKIKKILIIGQGRLLFVYNVRLGKVQLNLLENDEYLLLTSMIASIIQLAKRSPSKTDIGSMMFGGSKYIYRPLDDNFTIIIETDMDISEFDPQIQNMLDGLTAYIHSIHQKYGIEKVEDIINLSKYAERFSDLPLILRKLLK